MKKRVAPSDIQHSYLSFSILFCVFLTMGVYPGSASGLETVTVQLKWQHQFQFAGYYAAKEKGYYAEEGLDVILKPLDPQKDPVDSVLEGDAQYGVFGPGLLLEYYEGKPVVLLAQIFQHSPLVIMTKKDSGIDSPYGLAGKTFMTEPSKYGDTPLRAMLLSTLKTLDTVKIVHRSIGIEDFIAGKVDASSAYITDEPHTLMQLGIDFNIIDPRTYGIDFYGDNMFTTHKEVTVNPERVEKMLRATLKGWTYALEHQDELIEIILTKYNPKLDREHLTYEAEMTDLMIVNDRIPLGTVNARRYEHISDTYERLGLFEVKRNLRHFLYSEYKQQNNGLSPEGTTLPVPSPELTPEEKLWLAEHTSLRLGVDPLWPPFEFMDAKGIYNGIASSYVRIIEQSLDIDMRPVAGLTWSDVIDKAKSGDLDVLPCLVKTAERSEFLLFTKPYISYPMVIVTRDDFPLMKNIAEYGPGKLAVVKDYPSQEFLHRDYPGKEFFIADNIEDAMLAVSEGKIDAFMDNIASITYVVEHLEITNLRIAQSTPYRFDLSFGVRKDAPVLINILEKILCTIPEEEKLRIHDMWVDDSYQRKLNRHVEHK